MSTEPTSTSATSPCMSAEPQAEHHWLQRLVGDWTFEGEANMGPDQPASKHRGQETVRSIGGLWIIGEGIGEMPGGGPATMILTLGYDPAKQRFVGTWLGSMMTHLWVYDGQLDADRRILTLEAEGPDMMNAGKTTKYRDVTEMVNDNHRILTSHLLGADGTWTQFMTAHYRRVV